MADALSDYMEQEILDALLNVGVFPTAITSYVALFTTATTDAGGGTEVTNANAYARTATGSFTSTVGLTTGAVANLAEIAFPQCTTATWGTVTHIAIVDSNTHGAGNFLFHGALTTSKLVDVNDTFKIAIGDLDITLT
tara:strand:- start:1650 stop:2063 length:414 start_codon:yes stop_codon:yes gene_type:complete